MLGLYSTTALLRFWLQAMRADFYNPISQLTVKLTTSWLHPLRSIIPSIYGFDFAAILLAWLIKSIELFLVVLLLGGNVNLLGAALLWAIPQLVEITLNIFLIAILIAMVFSWISYPGMYNPAANLASNLADPIINQIRHMLPDMSDLDFSPVVASMLLILTQMLLLPPLKALTGSPF